MGFRAGEITLYQGQYPCIVESAIPVPLPYLVRFLTGGHPDDAVYFVTGNAWYTWCRSEDLSPVEDVEPLTADIDLSEVL